MYRIDCGTLCFQESERDLRYVSLIEKKILKKGWGNGKKVSLSWKQNLCVCVWERKNNSFKIHVIILRYIRNVNLPFKKDFKFTELFTKTFFFLYFRDRPKNGERNKQRRRRYYMRKSNWICIKKGGKSCEVNLNWLWTIEWVMDCFDCIFISTNDLA